MEDNNLTVALEDGWRVPNNLPSVLQQDFSFVFDGKVAIGAVEKRRGDECDAFTGAGRVQKMECLLVIKHQVWFPDVQ